MKKYLLILFVLISSISLTAYALKDWSSQEDKTQNKSKSSTAAFNGNFVNTISPKKGFQFVYNIDHRFMNNISKSKLNAAKSIIDLIPNEGAEGLSDFKNVKISKLRIDGEESAISEDEYINESQKNLINSLDYSSSFYIQSHCKRIDPNSGDLRNYSLVYYISITPEKEAEYMAGMDALIKYIKLGSKEEVALTNEEDLRAGQIEFIINSNGEVDNASIASSSAFTSLDEKMLSLIKEMPQKWKAAKDEYGNNVQQRLVFFYGKQGC